MISQAIKEDCIICLDYPKMYGTYLEILQFNHHFSYTPLSLPKSEQLYCKPGLL